MGTKGGPAIYDKCVLEAIADYDRKNEYTVYGLTEQTFQGLNIHNDNIKLKQIKPSGKWLGIAYGLTMELKRQPVDLLHATFVAPPIVPCPFVMTIGCWSQYDQPELYPPLIRWRLLYLYNKGIKNASAIFCYTNFLKANLIEKFSLDPEKIFVIGPGIGENIKVLDREAVRGYLAEQGISEPYILFIGTLNKRKNVHRLVKAYKILREETDIRHKLVLLGEHGYYAQEILDVIEELQLTDEVILTGRRQHLALPYFYNGADLFVFPSISEGFGLPPLEAMACGTPVVASNVTSVPEVVGDAACMVDPYNIEEMAEAMHKCLTDQELRRRLICRGKERARDFSWQDAAKKMVAAYETVYQEGW